MKRILLSLCVLTLFVLNKVNAQCTIAQASIKISNIVSVSNGTTCDVTFTLEFDIAGNAGNKWSFIHIWNANNAPNPAIDWNSKPKPNLALLQDGAGNTTATLLNTISLDYSGSDPNIITPRNYFPASADVDPYVQSTGISATKASGHFKINGIKISGVDCGNELNIQADVWSAQDQQGKNVACGTAGLSFVANDPVLRGQVVCNSPRSFTMSIHTTETRDITYTAYADANDNGIIDASDTVAANILKSPSNVPYSNVNVSNTGSSDPTVFSNYGPFQYQSANGTSNGVIIVAQGAGVINRSLLLIENGCSLLPVTFKSFMAVRNKSNVAIKWTTATEQNNKGFYVQRNTKGTWDNIALVFSAAQDGISTSDLSYAFNDLNNEKGVSQYRILQFDFDGRAKASEIRSVRGEAMASKLLVYPNPSMDGKVSVVFEDGNALRSLVVSDMSGRIVKQYRNISTNNLSIEGLENGVYSIQVIDLSSAAMSVEKIVIKKR